MYKKLVVSISFVMLLCMAVSVQAVPIDPGTNGLVAHYAFEDNANDSSENVLDGTVETIGGGAVTATFVDGQAAFGKALDLLPTAAGTKGSYVNLGDDPAFYFSKSMTVGAWVNIRSIPDLYRAVIAKGEAAWRVMTNGDTTSFQFAIGGAPTYPAANGVTQVGLNSWHYICGTYDKTLDANNAKLYVDGKLDGTLSSQAGIAISASEVWIGGDDGDTGWKPYRLFDGQIDEVVLYDRALSPDEISYLMGNRAPANPGTDGLVAYYAFNGDANDSSANKLDAKISTVGDANYVGVTFVTGLAGYGKAVDILPTNKGSQGSYVNCGADPKFDFVDAMTVGAWVNVRSIPDEWRAIVAKGDNAWRISLNGATSAVQYSIAGYGTRPAFSVDGKKEMGLGSWHYVCGTYDKKVGACLYVDGALEGTLADLTGISLNTNNVTIGANEGDTGWKPYRIFDGQIDEVRIYSRALTADEVKVLSMP